MSYRFAGEGTIGGVAGGRSVRANDSAGSVFTYQKLKALLEQNPG